MNRKVHEGKVQERNVNEIKRIIKVIERQTQSLTNLNAIMSTLSKNTQSLQDEKKLISDSITEDEDKWMDGVVQLSRQSGHDFDDKENISAQLGNVTNRLQLAKLECTYYNGLILADEKKEKELQLQFRVELNDLLFYMKNLNEKTLQMGGVATTNQHSIDFII